MGVNVMTFETILGKSCLLMVGLGSCQEFLKVAVDTFYAQRLEFKPGGGLVALGTVGCIVGAQ
jgi:hypothetical protein